MNWEMIGAVGETLGAVAVFVSLGYLAIQIRTSNTNTQAQTYRDVIERWNAAADQLWEPQTMSLMLPTLLGKSTELSKEDAVLFAARLSHMVNMHNLVVEVAEKGLLNPTLVDRIDNALIWVLSSPGGSAWWDHTGYMFPNHEYIENLRNTLKLDMTFEEWDEALYAKLKASQVG